MPIIVTVKSDEHFTLNERLKQNMERKNNIRINESFYQLGILK